jgi:hypothetical protein
MTDALVSVYESMYPSVASRELATNLVVDPWVDESKQIYWDLQQLNYDVKLMWIPTHVGISGNEMGCRWVGQTGSRERHRPRLHGQLTVANDHRILARQAVAT